MSFGIRLKWMQDCLFDKTTSKHKKEPGSLPLNAIPPFVLYIHCLCIYIPDLADLMYMQG